MTEREKMLAGEMYSPMDPELGAARIQAHALVQKLNSLPAEDLEGRERLTRQLLGGAGCNVWLEIGFQCDFGFNIVVGDNFFCNFNCVMLDTNTITIGDDCMFGPNVTLAAATHPIKAAERVNPEGREYALPIRIGDRVWLGAGVTVLPGVTIGDRAVVAAGAVVVRDVPPDTLVAGVPARVVKEIDNA
ncbi:MAG: sugar O-acetyltransferase [Oscillospiraceae bacterium]|nr:sugar O-acetyltransferase [Oscillospiraceae bacterium]